MHIINVKLNANINFVNSEGVTVGAFDLNGSELKFTGNPDEAAKVFIKYATGAFAWRLKEEYERGKADQQKESQCTT